MKVTKPLRRTAWSTGPQLTIAGVTRGPLIAVPLFTMFLGLLFFFPRFAGFAASLSHPYGRIVDRITGRNRNL